MEKARSTSFERVQGTEKVWVLLVGERRQWYFDVVLLAVVCFDLRIQTSTSGTRSSSSWERRRPTS